MDMDFGVLAIFLFSMMALRIHTHIKNKTKFKLTFRILTKTLLELPPKQKSWYFLTRIRLRGSK